METATIAQGSTLDFAQQKRRLLTAKELEAKIEREYEAAKEELDANILRLEEQFNAVHATLIEARNKIQDTVKQQDTNLRVNLITEYKRRRDEARTKALAENPDTNLDKVVVDKQFKNGLSVRVTPIYEYQAEDAVEWAVKHNMPNLLTVKKPSFKKLAAIQDFSFVAKTEAITGVISFGKD